MTETSAKFNARAHEYQVQSRIALAGYDACHELSACMLVAALGSGGAAHLLVAGAGGGAREVLTTGALELGWRFTAVDPSEAMMEIAVAAIEAAGLAARTTTLLGTVDDLPAEPAFDAATLIGVLHHIPGEAGKLALLRALAARMRPGAPLILAGNRMAYASHPLLLKAWGERWRMNGASPGEVEAKLGKILQGADPPGSEAEIARLLDATGFGAPEWFFSSLFWGACLARRA